eukprot:369922_1
MWARALASHRGLMIGGAACVTASYYSHLQMNQVIATSTYQSKQIWKETEIKTKSIVKTILDKKPISETEDTFRNKITTIPPKNGVYHYAIISLSDDTDWRSFVDTFSFKTGLPDDHCKPRPADHSGLVAFPELSEDSNGPIVFYSLPKSVRLSVDEHLICLSSSYRN